MVFTFLSPEILWYLILIVFCWFILLFSNESNNRSSWIFSIVIIIKSIFNKLLCQIHIINLILINLTKMQGISFLVANFLLNCRQYILHIHYSTLKCQTRSRHSIDCLPSLNNTLLIFFLLILRNTLIIFLIILLLILYKSLLLTLVHFRFKWFNRILHLLYLISFVSHQESLLRLITTLFGKIWLWKPLFLEEYIAQWLVLNILLHQLFV